VLDKSKAGPYRWRIAKNPLALIRSIAKRVALKQYPELLFGDDADKVVNPSGRAVSSLRAAPDGQTGTYADSEGEVLGTGYWHDEFIDAMHYRAIMDDGPDEELETLAAGVLAYDDGPLAYDWAAIGRKLELSHEQTKLLEARALGFTRGTAGEFLCWDQRRVERVWKSLQRFINRADIPSKARQALGSE